MEDTRSWSELQADMHQIALDHGWWDKERSPLEVIMLMITELDELDDEFRSEEPTSSTIAFDARSVAEELADFCIRLGDAAGRYEFELDPEAFPEKSASVIASLHPRAMLFTVAKPLLKAVEEFRKQERDKAKLEACFTAALDEAIIFADAFRLDLRGAILAKMEVNRARPYRHGNKAH